MYGHGGGGGGGGGGGVSEYMWVSFKYVKEDVHLTLHDYGCQRKLNL